MQDLKDVLEMALDNMPAAGGAADPAGDLARGRTLLRRRRLLGAAGVTAVFAAAAIAVVPAVVPDSAVHHASAGGNASTSAGRQGVRLVAYTGAQPPGYTVKKIPDGWVIQGSNPYALVIAPSNDSDKNPGSFLGKLMVGLNSTRGSRADGTAMTVNGHPAYYSEQPADGTATQVLVFENSAGQWLTVQAPVSLGWSRSQLAEFGAGVTVLATAQQSKG